MLENINWTLRRQLVQENSMVCTYMTNLVKDRPTVNMDQDGKLINTCSLFFTEDPIDSLVE